VLSDNRENAKRLAKGPVVTLSAVCRWLTHTHTSVANHSSPLNTIALSDADAETALAFVQQKLKEAKLDVQLTSKTTASVERLGGRASDLDSVRLPDLCVFVNCLNTHIC